MSAHKLLVDVYRKHHSPDGPAVVVPNLAGEPKFGVPLLSKLTFCAMVYLFPSQAPVVTVVAW
jgi:hypothetical protein